MLFRSQRNAPRGRWRQPSGVRVFSFSRAQHQGSNKEINIIFKYNFNKTKSYLDEVKSRSDR